MFKIKVKFGDQKHPWVICMARAPHLHKRYNGLKVENASGIFSQLELFVKDGELFASLETTNEFFDYDAIKSIVPKTVDTDITHFSPTSYVITYKSKEEQKLWGDEAVSMFMTTPVVGVGFTVLNHSRTETVVSRRMKGPDTYLYRWSVHGGKLELGETLIQGALRELREELGIVQSQIHEIYHRGFVEEIDTNADDLVDYHCLSHGFVVILKEGVTFTNNEPEKHVGMRWVKLSYLDEYQETLTPLTRKYMRQQNLISFKDEG